MSKSVREVKAARDCVVTQRYVSEGGKKRLSSIEYESKRTGAKAVRDFPPTRKIAPQQSKQTEKKES